MDQKLQNATVNNDAPITGGNNEVVVHNLQIREVYRDKLDISKYLANVRAAENRTNPSRIYLYDMYQHCLLDGHLYGILEKRINSVLNKELVFKKPDATAAPELNATINSYEFRKVMRIIMESIVWGISGIEFLPGPQMEARSIPRKHINTKRQIITFEQYQTSEGIDYTGLDNVWIIGEDDDLGLMLPACMYVIYKRNALADYANFIQIFGIPIRIAKFDVGDKATQTALADALSRSGSALSLMIPRQAEFTIEDGKSSNASGDLQIQFIDKMDQFLSIIVLGNTETTTNGKTGSQAKSKVHSQQQDQILKSDMALVESYLNDPHFLKILQSYGIPVVEGGAFAFNKDVDIELMKARVEIDTALVGAGVPMSLAYFYEFYNIPQPKEGEPTIGSKPQLPATTPPPLSDEEFYKIIGYDPNWRDKIPQLPPSKDPPILSDKDLYKMIGQKLRENDFFD